MTTESAVQHAPDSTGKSIATITVTRLDGTVVYRQEMVIADGDINAFRAGVSSYGELAVDDDIFNLRRRYHELAAMAEADQLMSSYARRGVERVTPTDKRGGAGRGSSR